MRGYFKFLLILALLASSNTVFSQRARSGVFLVLQGKVFKDKRPLPDALIKVVDENGYDIINTSTLKNGFFKLQLPLNSEYRLTIKYPFCYDKVIEVSTVIRGRSSWINWFFE